MREKLRLILPILEMDVHVNERYINAKISAIFELRHVKNNIHKLVDASKLEDPRFLSLMAFCDILIAKKCRLLRKYKNDISKEVNIEEYYQNAEKTLKNLKVHPETAPSVLFVLGELASYKDWKGELEETTKHFEEAETFYEEFRKKEYNGSFFVNLCFFGLQDQPADALKAQYVIMLLSKSGISKKRNPNPLWIIDFFKALKEMLDIPKHAVSFWISELISLTQSFAEAKCFEMVNYCLTIAETRLLEIQGDSPEYIKTKAEINCCTAEAGLLLLNLSNLHSELMEDIYKPVSENIMCQHKFEKYSHIQIEEKLPVRFLKNYEEAKAVFVKSVKLLQEAKSSIDFEKHDKLYIKIVRAISLAYDYFDKWEQSPDRLGKMQKRRVDALEDLKTKMILQNPPLNDFRFIYFELGDAYGDLMDVKLNLLVAEKTEIEKVVAKINRLRNSTVKNYEKFLRKSEISQDDEYSEDVSRILVVKVFLGVAYNKFLTNKVEIIIENMNKSLVEFRFVTNYLDKNLRAKVELLTSYEICQFYIKSLQKRLSSLELDPDSFDIRDHLRWATHYSFQKRYLINN